MLMVTFKYTVWNLPENEDQLDNENIVIQNPKIMIKCDRNGVVSIFIKKGKDNICFKTDANTNLIDDEMKNKVI